MILLVMQRTWSTCNIVYDYQTMYPANPSRTSPMKTLRHECLWELLEVDKSHPRELKFKSSISHTIISNSFPNGEGTPAAQFKHKWQSSLISYEIDQQYRLFVSCALTRQTLTVKCELGPPTPYTPQNLWNCKRSRALAFSIKSAVKKGAEDPDYDRGRSNRPHHPGRHDELQLLPDHFPQSHHCTLPWSPRSSDWEMGTGGREDLKT